MTQKVDFLGIGVQKAGTSWLWKNLRQHPSIWMPPRKELHYFDRSPNYPSPSYLASQYLVNRLFGKEHYNKQFRKMLVRELGGAIKKKDWERVRWNLRYCFGTYNDDWYLSLFEFGEGKLKGEITADYYILNLEEVKQIKAILPNLKTILILRNPIERAWSHIRYLWTRKLFADINDLEVIKKFIEKPVQTLRSDYVRTLNIWTSCFPQEQICIGFYDDIVQDPQKFLLNIFDFLGIENTIVFNNETLNKKVNVSRELQISAEIKYYLANKYYPEVLKLSNLVGGYSVDWLEEAEKILNATEKGTAANRLRQI